MTTVAPLAKTNVVAPRPLATNPQATHNDQLDSINKHSILNNAIGSTATALATATPAWRWNVNGGGQNVTNTTNASTSTTTMTTTKNAKNTTCNKVKRSAAVGIATGAVKKTRSNAPPAGSITHGTPLVREKDPISSSATTAISNSASIVDDTLLPLFKPISIVEAVKNNATDSKSKMNGNFPTQAHIYNPPAMGAQTKITGFFKSQVKPIHQNGTKKNLTNMAIRSKEFPPRIGLKKFCNKLSKPDEFNMLKGKDEQINTDIDVRALTAITTAAVVPAPRKVERKTAKVAPFASASRKPSTSTTSKKTLLPVLPKKPVNIAPRTMEMQTNANNGLQMISPVKCADVQQLQQKTAILQPKIHQPTVLLTAIRIPPNQAKPIQPQHHKTAAKIGGPMFQLASPPVMPKLVQIPNIVAPKDPTGMCYSKMPRENPSTSMDPTSTNNLVINNGSTHYFLNGAVIKLQQMATAQPHVPHAIDAVNNMLHKGQNAFLSKPMSLADHMAAKDMQQTLNEDQNLASHHMQAEQMNHNHAQQLAHFAASVPTGPHFQPFSILQRISAPMSDDKQVLMATSSGLLLTAALPTVMSSSHLPNLQAFNHHHHFHHQQHAPPTHTNQQTHTPSANILPNIHAATAYISSSGNYPFVPMAAAAPATQAYTPDNHHQPNTIINIPTPMSSSSSLPFSALSKSIASATSVASLVPAMSSVAMSQPKNTTCISVANAQTITDRSIIAPIASITSATSCVTANSIDGGSLFTNQINSNYNQMRLHSTATLKAIAAHESVSDMYSHTSLLDSLTSIPPASLASRAPITSVPTIVPIFNSNVDDDILDNASTTVATRTISTPTLIKPALPSPKSVLLETIQQKKPYDNHIISVNSMLSNDTIPLKLHRDLLKPPASIDTDITSIGLPECSKSPILSQPKTIRFPARVPLNGMHRTDSRSIGACYWDGCNAKCETSSKLIDHLQTHVTSQTGPFACRWANCKVYGHESSSRKYLERHVLLHGGSKKFHKCIIGKCGMRFSSRVSNSTIQSYVISSNL